MTTSGYFLGIAVGRVYARCILMRRFGSPHHPVKATRLKLDAIRSWGDLLAHAMERLEWPDISHLGVAMPGPVFDGTAESGGLTWGCDEEALRQSLPDLQGVVLTNVLVAVAEMLRSPLNAHQMITLRTGESDPRGPAALLGVSTGVGMATLHWAADGWTVQPSEGGHALFAPGSAVQMDLVSWFFATHGRAPTVEDLLGAKPHSPVYRFFREVMGLRDQHDCPPDQLLPEWLLQVGSDPERFPAATATLQEIARMILAEAGHLALRAVATHGVFLCGSMPARVLSLLQDPRLASAFDSMDSGPVRPLLHRVPLHVVREDYAPVIGVLRMLQGRYNHEFSLREMAAYQR